MGNVRKNTMSALNRIFSEPGLLKKLCSPCHVGWAEARPCQLGWFSAIQVLDRFHPEPTLFFSHVFLSQHISPASLPYKSIHCVDLIT